MKIASSLAALLAVTSMFSSVAGAAPLGKKQVAKYVGEEALTRAATLGMAVVGTVWTPFYEAIGAGFWAWESAHGERMTAQDTAKLMHDFPIDVKMLYGATFTRYGIDADGEPEDADLQVVRWTYDVKDGWGWDGLRDAQSNGAVSGASSAAGAAAANTGFHH